MDPEIEALSRYEREIALASTVTVGTDRKVQELQREFADSQTQTQDTVQGAVDGLRDDFNRRLEQLGDEVRETREGLRRFAENAQNRLERMWVDQRGTNDKLDGMNTAAQKRVGNVRRWYGGILLFVSAVSISVFVRARQDPNIKLFDALVYSAVIAIFAFVLAYIVARLTHPED